MAKRGADFQLTKDGSDPESGQEGAGPQRATAAQLAKRKIATGRKPGSRPAHSHSTPLGQPQAQSNIFGNIDPNIINGTSTQQNGFVNPFAHVNSAVQPAAAQVTLPPSSGFNFSVNGTSSIKNPFEGGFGQSNSSGGGGFQGSLFSIPAAPKPDKALTTTVCDDDDVPTWAPHSPFLANNNNNEKTQTQPSSTNSSFGSSFTGAQQAAPPTNPFASFGSQPTPSSNFSFGQSSTQIPQQQPASNLFGQTAKPTSNLFGQTPSQPQQQPALSNLFGQTSGQSTQQQSTSNIFGQASSKPQQQPAVSNIFGVTTGQSQVEPSTTKVKPSTASLTFSNALRQVEEKSLKRNAEGIFTQTQPSPTIFTTQSQSPQQAPSLSNNIFGHLATPQPQGTLQSQSTTLPKSPQSEQPQSPDDMMMSTSPPAVTEGMNNGSNGFSLSPTKVQPSSSSLFGRIDSASATSTAPTGPVNAFGITSASPQLEHESDKYFGKSVGPSSPSAQPEHESDKYFGKPTGLSTNQPQPTNLFSKIDTITAPSVMTANTGTSGNLFSSTATPNMFANMTNGPALSQSFSATPQSSNPFATLNKPAPEATAKPPSYESPFGVSNPQGTPASQATSIKPQSLNNGFRPAVTNGASNRLSEVTSKQVSTSAAESGSTSMTPSEGSTFMPPVIPTEWTDTEKREFVTAYRIRSLNSSLAERLDKFSLRPLDTQELDYFKTLQQAILDAKGLPMILPGKRKSTEDHTNNTTSPIKRAKLNGSLTNGEGATQPQFNFPTSGPNKRKAEEQTIKDSDGNGSADTAKKARSGDVFYPSLSFTPTSQTANLFASIANGTGSPAKVAASTSTMGNPFTTTKPLSGASESSSFTPSAETAKPSTNLFQFKPSSNDNTSKAQVSANLFTPKVGTTNSTADKQIAGPSISFKPAATQSSDSISSGSSAFAAQAPSASPFKFTPNVPAATTTTPTPSAQAPSASPFKFTPTVPATTVTTPTPSAGAVTSAGFQPPKFAAASGTNFLSQFGQTAKQDQEKAEKEAKAKRKAEEFDSEEDDEEEWERKDAERERAKKQKIEEAKNQAQGFKLSSTISPATITPPIISGASESAIKLRPDATKTSNLFEFKPQQSISSSNASLAQPQNDNIFGYLSNQGSDAEGSKTGEADDEGSDEEQPQKSPSKQQSSLFVPIDKVTDQSNSSSRSSSKSLFDRIETNADGTPKREVPSTTENEQPKNLFSFTQSSTQTPTVNPFSLSTSGGGTGNLFNLKPSTTSLGNSILNTPKKNKESTHEATSTSPQLDQTWKTDTPIKFGGPSAAPSINFTAASPAKPTFSGSTLFGGQKAADDSTPKPAFNIFGTPAATNTPSATLSAGFNFGGPPKSSLAAPSIFSSANTSRATSPGASTGAESAVEGEAEDAAPPEAQLDIATARAGEENEDILFEVKAKASEHKQNLKTEKLEWIVRGVGTLRVLKHKETGKSRIVVRGSPAGKIVLNTALMCGVDYKVVKEKMIMFMVANSEGGMEKWMVMVGKKEDAIKLQEILTANKGN